jgi:hypothetical protein
MPARTLRRVIASARQGGCGITPWLCQAPRACNLEPSR